MRLSDIKAGVPFIKEEEGFAGDLFPQLEFKPTVWIKIIPVKRLFNSTLIHAVVTRGSCFVADVNSGLFTILDGHITVRIVAEPKPKAKAKPKAKPTAKKPSVKKVKAVQAELDLAG